MLPDEVEEGYEKIRRSVVFISATFVLYVFKESFSISTDTKVIQHCVGCIIESITQNIQICSRRYLEHFVAEKKTRKLVIQCRYLFVYTFCALMVI